MSIKDKLLAKTSDLTAAEPSALPPPAVAANPAQFPPALPAGGAAAVAAARTGPGQMLQFRGQMLAVESELGKLRERLKAHEGALPARKLDAAQVHPSRWANRHQDAFQTADFMRLKQDIEQAGGNVQPVLVRPHAEREGHYELVFGHRRHRACAELGLPLLAVIDSEPMSELDLFAAMDRENRERVDLSPYEQGQMYRRALDEKLYPSNRRLAEALGVSHTWVANVLAVADLPQPVVDCFRSPLEIQHRHAKAIATALEHDRKNVLKRAERVRQQARTLAPAAVVTALVATTTELAARAGEVMLDGRHYGRWSLDASGNFSLQLKAAAMASHEPHELARRVALWLAAGQDS